jgi:3',5'-cyclic AMP phosphodiesterase CpdA
MRTLVHISDLHFGRVDPALLEPLAQAIAQARPDVLAISGDLTQRARREQFKHAAAYLRRLPQPQIVVPGNHDVPLYDVLRRFLAPLKRFRRYISAEEFPSFQDEEIAVVGLNTARSLTFKGGRINHAQVAEVARRFRDLPERVTRIVVTHHPFDLPAGGDESDLVGRATMAMAAFSGCGVDLFLSGHLHHSHAGNTAQRYRIDGYAALVAQAGTATSTRERGEANAFNVIRIGVTDMHLVTWRWQARAARFAPAAEQGFRYVSGRGWQPLA